MNADTIWAHLDTMQRACMADDSIIDRETFEAEPIEEQRNYYNWLRKQVGTFTAGPYWEES